jgi:hypothetical protein
VDSAAGNVVDYRHICRSVSLPRLSRTVRSPTWRGQRPGRHRNPRWASSWLAALVDSADGRLGKDSMPTTRQGSRGRRHAPTFAPTAQAAGSRARSLRTEPHTSGNPRLKV